MRKFVALAVIQLGFLAACGGGGGYVAGTPPPPPPTQMIATPGPPNVESVTVDAGPSGATFTAVNTPFVSLKVCAPGTATCQTIDHIWVDTGSSGLRILASLLTAVTLPAEKDAGGNPFAECEQFVDGTSWGSLALADITFPVSMETAANVNVHIIGDPAYPTIPSTCTGIPENTVASFGANGILGIGPFAQDCGAFCVTTSPAPPKYYSCPTPTTCAAVNASLTQQVQNPVTQFATDNNGVIIELPAVASAGATTVPGSLVFGIGTRTNNALGTATVLPADPNTGFITGTYKGTAYIDGYLDSGSNGNFVNDSSLTTCASPDAGFYCPASTVSETATLKGTSATTLAANFSVGNASMMFSANPSYTAFSNLGGPISDAMGFDLGLSFFYGHNVYTAIENSNTPGGIGPYFAY